MNTQRLFHLVHELIRNGTAPSDAFTYSRELLSKPMSQGDFMQVIRSYQKTAKYVTPTQAIKSGTLKPSKSIGQRIVKLGTPEHHVDLKTSLPIEFLKPAILDTYLNWLRFAQGTSSLGGQKLKHPSGKYASTISVNQTSKNVFTIYSASPYADVLETGRKPYNLYWNENRLIPLGKNSLIHMGRSPLNQTAIRTSNTNQFKAFPTSGLRGKAQIKAQTQYLNRYNNKVWIPVGPKSVWHIDSKNPMKVYSPAKHLWEKLQKRVKSLERTV